MKNILFTFCAIVSLTNCSKHNPACKNVNFDFSNLYADINASSDRTMDTEVHEYTFTLSSSQEVCEIGYRSEKSIKNTPYLIEIFDNDNSVLVYSESHMFGHKKTSYVLPSQPIFLNANQSYTIRRVQTNWGDFITNAIGELKSPNNLVFPIASGTITITGSNFYDVDSIPNSGEFGIPFIDLVFK